MRFRHRQKASVPSVEYRRHSDSDVDCDRNVHCDRDADSDSDCASVSRELTARALAHNGNLDANHLSRRTYVLYILYGLYILYICVHTSNCCWYYAQCICELYMCI